MRASPWHWRRFKRNGLFHWVKFSYCQSTLSDSDVFLTLCDKEMITRQNLVTQSPEDWACMECIRRKNEKGAA